MMNVDPVFFDLCYFILRYFLDKDTHTVLLSVTVVFPVEHLVVEQFVVEHLFVDKSAVETFFVEKLLSTILSTNKQIDERMNERRNE